MRESKMSKTVCYLTAICMLSLSVITGCSDDKKDIPQNYEIVIENIQNMPQGVTFNKVSAEINGNSWQIIATVTAIFDGSKATLVLPEEFDKEMLNPSQSQENQPGTGFWPSSAVSTDPTVGVAGLADIIAYNGDTAVGRLYRSNWSGKGSSADKAFVHYQYAEDDFGLSGSYKNFTYSADFVKGWNMYVHVNTSDSKGAVYTTTLPELSELKWYFEAW